MIGLFFIYWIWKSFTELAHDYGKNKWLYLLIGIASYYLSTMIGGFVVGILSVVINGIDVNGDRFLNPGWNLLFVLCGLLGCFGTYKLLQYKGEKEIESSRKDGIENIGVNDEN